MATAGIQQQYFTKVEATYDTYAAFSATDAANFVSMSIEPTLVFEKTVEHVGTASLQSEIEGKRGGTWTVVSYIHNQGSTTNPQYLEPLLTGAMSAGSSGSYTLTDSQTISSLQMARYTGDDLYEVINGCWVESMEISYDGGGIPTLTFSGGFATYGWCYGGATVNGAHTTSDTTIQLQTGDGERVGVNAEIKFDTEDNSGAGYQVTAVDLSTDIVTISPGIAGNLVDNDVVAPVIPTPTYQTTTIVGSIANTLTVGGTSIGVISGKTTLNTGIQGLDGESTASKPNRLVRGAREVTGELSVYFLDENTPYLGGAWAGNTLAIVQNIGGATTGLKVNTPSTRIEVSPIEVPDADVATATINFVARESAAAADELDLDFT